jgi:hypothetical protein
MSTPCPVPRDPGSAGTSPGVYQRRRPERTVPYQAVRVRAAASVRRATPGVGPTTGGMQELGQCRSDCRDRGPPRGSCDSPGTGGPVGLVAAQAAALASAPRSGPDHCRTAAVSQGGGTDPAHAHQNGPRRCRDGRRILHPPRRRGAQPPTHYHCCVTDGMFSGDASGVCFHTSTLNPADIQQVQETVRQRRLFERRGLRCAGTHECRKRRMRESGLP